MTKYKIKAIAGMSFGEDEWKIFDIVDPCDTESKQNANSVTEVLEQILRTGGIALVDKEYETIIHRDANDNS